jgi:hypothetical protein
MEWQPRHHRVRTPRLESRRDHPFLGYPQHCRLGRKNRLRPRWPRAWTRNRRWSHRTRRGPLRCATARGQIKDAGCHGTCHSRTHRGDRPPLPARVSTAPGPGTLAPRAGSRGPARVAAGRASAARARGSSISRARAATAREPARSRRARGSGRRARHAASPSSCQSARRAGGTRNRLARTWGTSPMATDAMGRPPRFTAPRLVVATGLVARTWLGRPAGARESSALAARSAPRAECAAWARAGGARTTATACVADRRASLSRGARHAAG